MKPKVLLIGLNPATALPFKTALEADGLSVCVTSTDSGLDRDPYSGRYDLAVTFWKTRTRTGGDSCVLYDALFLIGDKTHLHTLQVFQDGLYAPEGMDGKTGKFVNIVRDLLNHHLPDANPVNSTNRQHASKDEPNQSLAAIIGESPGIKELRRKIVLIARFPIKPILITGETGTGKELVAEALHQSSPLSHKPFLRINCSAIPDTLLESQLFGHRRGSFTGAVRDQKGIFEAADGGTVLLDEIGDLKLSLQPKLLRFLENGTFYRVGETTETRVNVWVIASTNADLEELVSKGFFRKDLFYRLNPLKLNITPLYERMEDIPFLVDEFARKMGFNPDNIDQRFVDKLLRCRCRWDGNVRELRHMVESYLIHGDTGMVKLYTSESEKKTPKLSIPSGRALENMEKEHIRMVFLENGRKIRPAARILKIDPKTLKNKLIKFGIHTN